MYIYLYREVSCLFSFANFNSLRLGQSNVTLRKWVVHGTRFVSRVPVENNFFIVFDHVCVATKLAHFCLQVAIEVVLVVVIASFLQLDVLTVIAAALRDSLGA